MVNSFTIQNTNYNYDYLGGILIIKSTFDKNLDRREEMSYFTNTATLLTPLHYMQPLNGDLNKELDIVRCDKFFYLS